MTYYDQGLSIAIYLSLVSTANADFSSYLDYSVKSSPSASMCYQCVSFKPFALI